MARSGMTRRWARRLKRRTRRVQVTLSLPAKHLYARGIISTDGLVLPDFLLIGAQKAGTTWLAKNLSAHPEVSVARRKRGSDLTEIRYFSHQFHRSLRYYADHFRDLPGPVRGDKSPSYSVLPPERVGMIGRLLPEARVLVVLRNPVDRAWSHALMNLVTLPGRRFEDVPESRFLDHFWHQRRWGDYSRILETWEAAYSPERMWVGFFDDVAERPTHVLDAVFEFLGVSPERDWTGYPFQRRINRGPGIPLPERYRRYLTDLYGEEIERLGERLGGPVERWAGSLG